MTESHLITAVIDAKQGCNIMTANIPNAFVQMDIENKPSGKRIIMKIRGQLVNMLVNIASQDYQNLVHLEGNQKVLYVEMLKALYSMLQSSLLYYRKLCKDLNEIRFKINRYDPCVANKMINRKQHTVTWHIDNIKSSHINLKVNNEFLSWF
jgi:hypothetical protein